MCVGVCGCMWTHVDTCMWVGVDVCGCIWLHVDVVDVSGYVWMRVDTCRCVWMCMHVDACGHVDTCGYVRMWVGTCGYMWRHVDVCGCVWPHVGWARTWAFMQRDYSAGNLKSGPSQVCWVVFLPCHPSPDSLGGLLPVTCGGHGKDVARVEVLPLSEAPSMGGGRNCTFVWEAEKGGGGLLLMRQADVSMPVARVCRTILPVTWNFY